MVLDEAFYEHLRRHPVPLREAALRELADRSLGLDIYIWLAYRLHNLDRPTPVRWAALRDQFGGNGSYSELRVFRREFRKALAPAVAAYPEAMIKVEEEGLILHPSRPPVAPRLVTGVALEGAEANPPARRRQTWPAR